MARPVGREGLESYNPIQECMPSLENDAHPPMADTLKDLVRTESAPRDDPFGFLGGIIHRGDLPADGVKPGDQPAALGFVAERLQYVGTADLLQDRVGQAFELLQGAEAPGTIADVFGDLLAAELADTADAPDFELLARGTGNGHRRNPQVSRSPRSARRRLKTRDLAM